MENSSNLMNVKSMKAVVREKYGNPNILKVMEISSPQPKPNEVLVKVHYATVNRSDCSLLTGKPYIVRFVFGLFRPKVKVTGTAFSGQVVAIGDRVTQFKIGDRVFGFDDNGNRSHAGFMVVDQNKPIKKIPKSISYDLAAASAEGAHYAINFLNKIDIQEGDKVLVNGATGAIGSSLIQLLKQYRAIITAVCNTKNISLIASMGVYKTIDYEKFDFTKDGQKYKYVLDAVGKSRFSLCRNIMTSNGTYISSELGPNAENIYYALTRQNKKRQRVIFPVPKDSKNSLDQIAILLESQEFKPIIDRIYPIDDIVEAFKYVQTGMKTGNVMLKIDTA